MSYVRLPYHGPVDQPGAQDQDNVVRNLITILTGPPDAAVRVPGGRPLSKSIKGVDPVVTLEDIKMHCKIEADRTDEEAELLLLEMAAHIHTQNVLRRAFDVTVGENVKLAMLHLIAHWYRNREAIITGTIATIIPLTYDALLAPERDYTDAY